MPTGETEVVHIEPDGNILVEVSGPAGKTRLLVSSKILSLVSPVFAKMLNGRFKEGLSNHRAMGDPLIPLPEDDAEAFTILCRVTHYRMNELPHVLSASTLRNFAILCDKYDCTNAVRHSSATWLRAAIEARDKDFNNLLFASYVLDIPDAFARISWEIMVLQVGPFKALPGVTDQDLVSRDLLPSFETRKMAVSLGLQSAMERGISRALSAKCSEASQLLLRYIRELESSNLWPFSEALMEYSIFTIMDKMRHLSEPRRPSFCLPECSFCKDKNFSFRHALCEWVDIISRDKFGVCLDCVKRGRKSYKRGKCRLQHF